MSKQPIQVLSDSEIPSEFDTGKPSAFESEFPNTDIQELTQSNGSKSQDINRYHCIKTKGDIDLTPYNVQSEKIGDIIKRLDVQTEYDNNNENDSEILTRKQFASSMTDMRNDVLSMINLLGCLNSSYTSSDGEMRHIKKDLYKVVQENAHLKKKINEIKTSHDKHYESLANCYEDRFKRIFKRLNIKDSDSNFKHLINSSVRGNTNINNGYIDSQQEKKTNKFKVVPKRTLKKGIDRFGDNNTEEFTMSESSTQPVRRDRFEDTSKNSSDKNEYRLKRLRFRRFDC